MSEAGKILDAFLADEFHGMVGMAEGDVERSQILHLIEYVLKRSVTESKTIDKRVDEFFDGILDDYIDYHDDSLLGRAGMAYLQKAVELKDVVNEFRRHLHAHEKQVRQEERQGIALAMEDAYKRGWQHAGFAKTLPREEVCDGER